MSTLLALSGFVSLGRGVWLWVRRQPLLDEKEELETEKVKLENEALRRKLEPMTDAEVMAKGVEDELEEVVEQSLVPSVKASIQSYFNVEKIVFEKLIACYGEGRVLTNYRMRETDYEYDAILLPDRPESEDIIFEVKYLTRRMGSYRIQEIAERLIVSTQAYVETVNREATVIAIFVVAEPDLSSLTVDKYMWAFNDKVRASGLRIYPIVIEESDLVELDCNELRRRIKEMTR